MCWCHEVIVLHIQNYIYFLHAMERNVDVACVDVCTEQVHESHTCIARVLNLCLHQCHIMYITCAGMQVCGVWMHVRIYI